MLGVLSAFAPFSMDMYLPSLPALTADLQTVPATAQLTLSACLLGLALGQPLAGPLSDALGRRRPLMAGLALYIVASLLCAVAPSVEVLVVCRFVQGAAGATGIVIARAIVRDRHTGVAAAQFFTNLMLVSGLAPMVAPLLGGQLLRLTSWRGVFLALMTIGALLLLGVVTSLRETLPAAQRRTAGLTDTRAAFGRLLRDPRFLGYALPSGLTSAAMFAYISGSPFVLQEIFGVSPQAFSLIFAANAFGLWLAAQVSGRLVRRVGPAALMRFGVGMSLLGGLGLLGAVVTGAGLAGMLPALWVVVASVGLVMPNATALALMDYPRDAGSASGILGVMQYSFGAAAAPLVGIAGTQSALPMATVIALFGLLATGACWALASRGGSAPAAHVV